MRKSEAYLYLCTIAVAAVSTGIAIAAAEENIGTGLCAAVAVFFGLATIVDAIQRATIILQETLETLKEELRREGK